MSDSHFKRELEEVAEQAFVDEVMAIGKARLPDSFAKNGKARHCAESLWLDIPNKTLDKLDDFILSAVKWNTPEAISIARMDNAVRWLARELASYGYGQEPQPMLAKIVYYPPEHLVEKTDMKMLEKKLEEITKSVQFKIEFTPLPTKPIIKKDKTSLQTEIILLNRNKQSLKDSLKKNFGKCADMVFGENILHYAHLDMTGKEDDDYFCFRSVNSNPKKNDIPLEFFIDKNNGRVMSVLRDKDKNGIKYRVVTDVTEYLDSPEAMAEKIKDANKHKLDEMQTMQDVASAYFKHKNEVEMGICHQTQNLH